MLSLTLELERDRTAPARARTMVRGLRLLLGEERTEDATLLVSELVTNAVRHAQGERFDVHLEVTPDMLRLEVRDDGEGFRPRIAPSEDGTGGYGLYIVDRLASRWGVERDPGAVIWLEVDR